MTFYDVVDLRPMTSLRRPTWRFSPFRSQDWITWSLQTSDISLIEKNLSVNWPVNDQLSDQEIDPKNRNLDSRESLKVRLRNSKSDFLYFSDFRGNWRGLHADNFDNKFIKNDENVKNDTFASFEKLWKQYARGGRFPITGIWPKTGLIYLHYRRPYL